MSSPRIFVAGHHGMVGSAIVRQLEQNSDCEILTASKQELDLCDQSGVNHFLSRTKLIKFT